MNEKVLRLKSLALELYKECTCVRFVSSEKLMSIDSLIDKIQVAFRDVQEEKKTEQQRRIDEISQLMIL